MSDEFDALSVANDPPQPSTGQRATRVARLVCRIYRAATPTLRSRMLTCLLRPLGTLATVGVAAGAFSCFLYREGTQGARAAIDDVARFSNEQVIELARFVEQVSPDALHDLARLLADRSTGLAAFSASAALLLMKALRQQEAYTVLGDELARIAPARRGKALA